MKSSKIVDNGFHGILELLNFLLFYTMLTARFFCCLSLLKQIRKYAIGDFIQFKRVLVQCYFRLSYIFYPERKKIYWIELPKIGMKSTKISELATMQNIETNCIHITGTWHRS